MGGDTVLKFFEYQTPLDLSSPFNFLRTVLINLVFAPFKLIVEIGRKVIFLPRAAIDKLLLTSIGVAIVYSLIASAVMVYSESFSLWYGKFPLIIPLIAIVSLIVLYFVFNSLSFVLYEHLEKMYAAGILKDSVEEYVEQETYEEGKGAAFVKEGVSQKDISAEQGVQPEEPAQERFSEREFAKALQGESPLVKTKEHNAESAEASNGYNDFRDALTALKDSSELDALCNSVNESDFDFFAEPNMDVINSEEIRKFQNRLRDGIDTLGDYGERCSKFSEEELSRLDEKMESVTDPSKFIDESLIEAFKQEDFAEQALHALADLDIDCIPSDFTLLS